MKILLRENVRKLGTIGDIVVVKPGYARNYLLPQGIGAIPTEQTIAEVEAAKAAYLAKVAKMRAEIEARAAVINGKEVTIPARANEEGHLYGSIGPAQIAHALEEINVPVSPDEIMLAHNIQQLDKYEVTVELDDDITATVSVWVVPIREPGEEAPAAPTDTDEDTENDDEDSL